MSVHPSATDGYAVAASSYDRGRPGYAPAAVDALAAILPSSGLVCDVAAGTGKWTRQIAGLGAGVVAVEPVAAMRTRLVDTAPEVAAVSATAESLPFAAGTFDAVCVASAMHWFRLDAAVPELVRVLRPGGHLVVVRNDRDTSVPWVAELDAIVQRHRPASTPASAGVPWRDRLLTEPALVAVVDDVFDNPEVLDEHRLVERARSLSHVAALSQEVRDEVIGEVRALARRLPARFTMPYRTRLLVLRKQLEQETDLR